VPGDLLAHPVDMPAGEGRVGVADTEAVEPASELPADLTVSVTTVP
jgi:hypothetical protein